MGKKDVETVCTPSPQNNAFKMITNYIVGIAVETHCMRLQMHHIAFAHVSFKATVRLKTKCPSLLSLSTVK